MGFGINEKPLVGKIHCGLQRPGKECPRNETDDANCPQAPQCFKESEIIHRASSTIRVLDDKLTIDGKKVIHRIVKIPHEVIRPKDNGSCAGEIFTVYQKGPGREIFSLGSSCEKCGIVPDIFTPEEIFD